MISIRGKKLKVKEFRAKGDDANLLEEDIQDWLETCDGIVINITQSQSQSLSGWSMTTIFIWYTEKDDA